MSIQYIKVWGGGGAKVVLKENFMVLNTLKKGRSQVNNPGIHVKKLEKEQNKPKDRRKKKRQKSRVML